MQEYFIALVDGTIEASVKYVREYVHAYLSDMLEEARGNIHSYGQSFGTTMQAALSTKQQGWSLFGLRVVCSLLLPLILEKVSSFCLQITWSWVEPKNPYQQFVYAFCSGLFVLFLPSCSCFSVEVPYTTVEVLIVCAFPAVLSLKLHVCFNWDLIQKVRRGLVNSSVLILEQSFFAEHGKSMQNKGFKLF